MTREEFIEAYDHRVLDLSLDEQAEEVLNEIYDSIELKNIVARFEGEAISNDNIVENLLAFKKDIKVEDGKTYIVTIQEKPND